MIIGVLEITFHVGWVHSLKEKRMVVKSICAKAGNKFNISIAEVAEQELHQKIVLGIACVTSDVSHCHSILDNVLNFVEDNTEAEILNVSRDIY